MKEVVTSDVFTGVNDYLFDLTICIFSPLYRWANPLSIRDDSVSLLKFLSKSGGVDEENILWNQFSFLYALNPFSIFLTYR